MIAANKRSRGFGTKRRSPRLSAAIVFTIALAINFSASLWSQSSTAPVAAPPPAANQEAPEIASHEETPTFKVKVNLVEVRVVVRDAQGHAIGNLKQEDFQLFDNGKPQTISKFSVEKAGTAPIVHQDTAAGLPATDTQSPTATAMVPQRYIAYLFDDIHLTASDLAQARDAATHQLQSMQPTDRVAIYTTSGQNQLDFTDDRAQLIATLNRLIPRPITQSTLTQCPDVSYYMADLIQNQHDPRALSIATLDALHCAYLDDTTKMQAAQQLASSTALQELNRGDAETQLSLSVLKNVVRRISALPGDRTIILVSPGFLNPDQLQEQTETMERALHSDVVINTLDVRGLYTELPDVSQTRVDAPKAAGTMQEYRSQEMHADDDILAELAYTTGGTFFHNNNDLKEGFQRLASPPEYSYLLGFTPQNLKPDGHYHKLKVALKPPAKGDLRARKGYYAPKGAVDASEQAKQEIEDAVFSRDELRDIPVEVHTQFFKSGADDAKLSVVVHMDLRHVHFRKADGRNNEDVTIVSALFDRNGNFLTGNQKLVQLRLKDSTLEDHLGSGVTLKSSFDVKPGSYIVRLVVRDAEGQLAAQNSAVEIP